MVVVWSSCGNIVIDRILDLVGGTATALAVNTQSKALEWSLLTVSTPHRYVFDIRNNKNDQIKLQKLQKHTSVNIRSI